MNHAKNEFNYANRKENIYSIDDTFDDFQQDILDMLSIFSTLGLIVRKSF